MSDVLFKTFNLKVGNFTLAPNYLQAGLIVLLIFLLVWTFARLRYLYVHWSLGKSAIAFLFWGFLLAVIVEGFLIIGGRTIFTGLLGWKNAPKPISTVLDVGRARLMNVLGESDEIPQSDQVETYQSVMSGFERLEGEEKDVVRLYICEP